ncbi:MAG: hypothetical protein QM602_03815 [Microbacterium sp.]
MSEPPRLLDAVQAERWLSAPRYQRYLAVAGGDHALAMETYLWNSRVAAAGIVDVGHLEIAIRNAHDRELSRRFPDWSINAQSPLFRLEQGVQRARARQHRRNQASLARIADAKRGLSSAPTHAEVVAALTSIARRVARSRSSTGYLRGATMLLGFLPGLAPLHQTRRASVFHSPCSAG